MVVGAVWIWCADGRDTHPELLEGIRLPRGLPEQRDEVHAVALGLEVGHQTRGVLHLLRRGCRGWRGKREGSVIGEVLLGRGIVGGETRSRRRGRVRRGRPGRSPVGSARVPLTALDFPTLARASDEPDILRRVHRCRPRHAQTLNGERAPLADPRDALPPFGRPRCRFHRARALSTEGTASCG